MDEVQLLSSLDPVDSGILDIVELSPSLDELFSRIVSEVDLGTGTAGLEDPRPLAMGTGLRAGAFQRRRLALLAAAAVLILAVALPMTLGRQGGLGGPTRTPWRPARQLASGSRVGPPLAGSSKWRLVSDIVPTGWRLNTSGPAPGDLSCPTTSACYVTGDGSTSDSGPADLDSLYFSDDGGLNWEVLALPAGFSFTAPLSCSDSADCSGGGLLNRQPVFISTADGGHEWTVLPVPFSDEFVSVACASPSNCAGITASASVLSAIDGSEGASSQPGEVFVATSDGGRTWSSTALPPAESVTSLACPSVSSCTVIGYSPSATLKGLVMSASHRSASRRSASRRLAPNRLAPRRSASRRLAPRRSALRRSASRRTKSFKAALKLSASIS